MKAFVIEDERRVASFIARVLKEEGFRVETCSSGVRGLAMATRGIYDIILVDWTLPDFDGLSIVRSMRSAGSSTPILMLTARRETVEKRLAFEAGVDDYLPKPFDVEELVARVNALIRRTGGFHFEIGPVRVDGRSNEAYVAEQPLTLADREFDLLVYLARRRPRTATKSEIVATLWPELVGEASNVVDATVSRLREKLGEAAWIIESVQGKRYRVIDTESAAESPSR